MNGSRRRIHFAPLYDPQNTEGEGVKVLVAVKRVVDANFRVRVKADNSGVELDNVKMSMNPFDEIAVEEAVRLKEAGIATEIVVVSIGPAKAEDTLRQALAMGADRAILVVHDGKTESLGVAKTLRRHRRNRKPGPDPARQAGHRRRHQRDRPDARRPACGCGQGTFASKIVIADGKATVTREVDGGLQTLELALPAVVTADLRLNTPRFVSLPNIIKARVEAAGKDHRRRTRRRSHAAAQDPAGRRAAAPRGRRHGRSTSTSWSQKLRAAEVLP